MISPYAMMFNYKTTGMQTLSPAKARDNLSLTTEIKLLYTVVQKKNASHVKYVLLLS